MGGYFYTTKSGDMWDYIAWVVYNEERFAETLMRAEENRELLDIYIFSDGVRVWCPYVEEQDQDDEEPVWRSDQ